MYGKDGKLIKSPTNTKAQDPMLHLGNMLFGGGIEADEERGQQELLESEVLPSDLNYSERSDFEALGFVFGDVVENDPIFRVVTIPDGWTRVGSDHSMWSYIEDERGIRRVSIFYKAAFYDRNAHMSLDNVGYSAGCDYIYEESQELDERLTLDELTEVCRVVMQYRQDIFRSPQIYGKYETRIFELEHMLVEKLWS